MRQSSFQYTPVSQNRNIRPILVAASSATHTIYIQFSLVAPFLYLKTGTVYKSRIKARWSFLQIFTIKIQVNVIAL